VGTKRFELKKEHIALLRKAVVGWQRCEFGAPEIDPKRPYGNSDVYSDIAEILKLKPAKDDHSEQAQYEVMDTLHKETETALQIVLCTGSFEPGVYETREYFNDWKRVR
jgi:hypothetical protein